MHCHHRSLRPNSNKTRDARVHRLDLMNATEIDRHPYLNIQRNSPLKLKFYALENVALNMFCILTGNLIKFDHNVYIQRTESDERRTYGAFLYIDNDRATFRHTSKSIYHLKVNGMKHIICMVACTLSV